jgi:hypothetical protein
MVEARSALITGQPAELGKALALARFLGTVSSVFFGIANTRLANVQVGPRLSSGAIEAGTALVAVYSLGVVLTPEAMAAAVVASMNVQAQPILGQFLFEDALR